MSPWDRRDFLFAAGAAAGSCAGAAAPAVAACAAITAVPAGIVVADSRFAESRAFAAEAARTGGRIVWTQGDVTRLWYEELDLRWRREKVSLSGLTAYPAFFYLQRLAMDRGLRVIASDEHFFARQRLIRWAIAAKPRASNIA